MRPGLGDVTGLPMRKEELEGRKGKQPDGTATAALRIDAS